MFDVSLFDPGDWTAIRRELLKHADSRIRTLTWNSGNQLLPKGTTAEDLVLQAIEKTLEGVRHWNSELYPDPVQYLKSVIDSDVNHLVSSREHRLTQYGLELIAEDPRSPEAHLIQKENDQLESVAYQKLIRFLLAEFSMDRDATLLLLNFCRHADREEASIKPARVSKETGVPITAVRNAIRRLRRKVRRRRDSGPARSPRAQTRKPARQAAPKRAAGRAR
jgi:hypothetical protein